MSTTSSPSITGDDFNYNTLKLFDHVGGDRLQILNQIGKSQALVFHALDLDAASGEVAVKVIECRSKSEDEFRKVAARIRGEVQAWQDLEVKSPYILPLKGVICHRVETPDQRFIAFVLIMPYAPLGDLKKYIREKFSKGLELSVSRLRTFLLQISEALEAVHASGFVHKDIKSSNVLIFQGRVESNGKRGLLPKLADFGITRNVLDKSHGVEGTWEYMAPEAFDVDPSKSNLFQPSSDIYSLGVLFYETITGVLPHIASGLSQTEKFAAYETLHKSGNINFSAVRAKMGVEMEALIKSMLSVDPEKRPKTGSLVEEINDLIFAAQHGERTAQGTHSIPASIYRWNPFVHDRLKSQLCYYFLKGQNSKNDHLWICDKLKEEKISGYSLYKVIGGIDLIVRIWEDPSATSAVVARIMKDFEYLQSGYVMRFKVNGFQSISSRPTISFSRFDKVDVSKVIFENLKVDREDEYKALSEAGVVIGRLGFDDEKDTFPLRVFAAFRMISKKNSESVIQERIIAREIYETLLPFQADKKVAGLSVYWGAEAYSLFLKVRLKKFEDYELIWEECLKSLSEIYKGVFVQSDTYLELNRISIRESDDGNIWKEVDKYRLENHLSWPRSAIQTA